MERKQLSLPMEIPATRKEQWDANYKELNKILGFKVPIDGFIFAISGKPSLDVVKLDGRLKVADGTSLANHIKQNYGERAGDLANDLINF